MQNIIEVNKAAAQPVAAESKSVHAEFIVQAIPDWLLKATAQRREAVKDARTTFPDWYTAASTAQRKTLQQCFEKSMASQTLLDKNMANLQTIDAFAEPLLVKALKERFAVALDVNETFVQLNKALELGKLHVQVGTFEVLKLPLLQAALHNFEEVECRPAAFHSSSGFVARELPGDQFRKVVTSLSVAQFTSLCRELDIGAKYQVYLKQFLHANPVAEAVLRHRFVTSQKDALRAAAEVALLKNDIRPGDYSMILSVTNGELKPFVEGKPVWFRRFSLMKKRTAGCMAFVISEKYRYSDALILYVPHDPEHPLKRYTWDELNKELKRQFTARDPGQPRDGNPTDFQRFFSQFVAYKDRPYYFSQFTHKAAGSVTDPFAPLRPAVAEPFLELLSPLVGFIYPQELPPAPADKLEPEDDPYLAVSTGGPQAPWGNNPDPWLDLFQLSQDRIFDDARYHAVPTADVDAKVRAEKLAKLLEIGMLVFNGVSLFVPVLGEVMIGVMAGQLMYETFESAIEWSEGDRRAALAHLTDVAENLALIAVLQGAGKGLARLNAVKPEPLIEGLQPVTLANGKQRLWKPDLAPYQSSIRLPTGSKPNDLGLHGVNAQEVLQLDDSRYVVKQDPDSGQYRVQHPSRSDAYSPQLEHNGDGAWQHEAEEPLTWDGPILMRRLGYRAETLTDTQLEQARVSSGIESDQLRQLHVDQSQPPGQLSDTLTRFRLDSELDAFNRQVSSDDPLVYAQADLGVQFRIMRHEGLLPEHPLQVMDSQGTVIWEDAVDARHASGRLEVVVSERDARQGTVLKALLEVLHAQDKTLSGVAGNSMMSLEQRATELRKDIARGARRRKQALFESLYTELDASMDDSVSRIKVFFPELPSVVVKRLLVTATEEELATLSGRGPLPQRLYGQAETARQELRLSRAYEGLYLDASSGLDSERLALRSLQNLPGWPKNVHLELREYGPQGVLLDAIGDTQAPVRAVLVLDEQTGFSSSATSSLYSSVLQALTPAERGALGFTLDNAQKLQQAVQQNPVPRDLFRGVLLTHRVLKPSVPPGVKLLGGVGPVPVGQQVVNFFREPRVRVLKLYPDFDQTQVEAFLQSLGSDVRGGLTRLEAEYKTLKLELNTWIDVQITEPEGSFLARPVPRETATVVANEIKRCWRRQGTPDLHVGARMELPSLSADFSHVETVRVLGSANIDGFLKRFTGVKRLELQRVYDLRGLPGSIGAMKGLEFLKVYASELRLDEGDIAVLSSLTNLEELSLRENKLGLLPDFSVMPRLKRLNLNETAMEQWPRGIEQLTDLQTLDLRNNQLTQVPQTRLFPTPDHVDGVARVNRGTYLEGNPFEPQVRQQLIDYRERLAQARPELVEGWPEDAFSLVDPIPARVRQLYPEFTSSQIDAFAREHGNGLEAEVTRLEREYGTLNQQLSAWAFSGGGSRQHYVLAGRRQAFVGQASRYEAADRIRRCWRRQSPQRNANDGGPIGYELDLSGQTLDSVPDLDADFSHVGSLKLDNMGMSVSPEGFLARFRGVRWLDMSKNQLTEIPPALGEMNGLTRLSLQQNRIQLTTETTQLLAGRTTLRALGLAVNPLGQLPDFSQMTDLRSLSLNSAGVHAWPVGLGEQPLLDTIDLRNNRIETIPEALIAPPIEQLERVAQLNNITYIAGNPLSEAAQQQLNAYWSRLERERPDLWRRRSPEVFEYQAPRDPTEQVVLSERERIELQRWSEDLSVDQLATRQAKWQTLFRQPHSNGFFRMLRDLDGTGAAHEDLQQRVWTVIDSITQTNLDSTALREQMFTMTREVSCCDRAALVFSDLQVMVMVSRINAQTGETAPDLLKLARGLFRLDEVEKIALAEIRKRRVSRPNESVDEIEVKLGYRVGLKDRLELPGQPPQFKFIDLAKVTKAELDKAYGKVIALDNSPEEFQSLVGKDFWKEYLTSMYRPQFEALRDPYLTRHEALRESHQAGQLTMAAYEAQSEDLSAQLQIEEMGVIKKLTHEELVKHPL